MDRGKMYYFGEKEGVAEDTRVGPAVVWFTNE